MSGKVSDLPTRFKRALFRQKKLDRINFRSGKSSTKCTRCPHWSVGVARCWSCAWSHDSLSHGIDKMSDPVMLSIFGVHVCPSRCDMYARSAIVSVLPPGIDVRKLQRSHSELSRVEQLSGLLSRLFFGLPTRFTYLVYLPGLPCSHRLYPV